MFALVEIVVDIDILQHIDIDIHSIVQSAIVRVCSMLNKLKPHFDSILMTNNIDDGMHWNVNASVV